MRIPREVLYMKQSGPGEGHVIRLEGFLRKWKDDELQEKEAEDRLLFPVCSGGIREIS